MEEHRRYNVRCAVFGSKPHPSVEWYIGDDKIEDPSKKDLVKKDNRVISVLNYVAKSAHNGRNLTCKAYNKKIPYDYVKDSVAIVVQCMMPMIFIKTTLLMHFITPRQAEDGNVIGKIDQCAPNQTGRRCLL